MSKNQNEILGDDYDGYERVIMYVEYASEKVKFGREFLDAALGLVDGYVGDELKKYNSSIGDLNDFFCQLEELESELDNYVRDVEEFISNERNRKSEQKNSGEA